MTMKMPTRATLLFGMAAAVALGLASAPADAQTKIRGGISVRFEGMLAVFAAQEKGYLKAENIDFETVDFKGGGPTVQAFAGNSIDICFCAADHAVRLRNRGIPTVVLYGLDDRHNYTLIGRAQNTPAAGGIAALKGKTLGITSPGSMTDNTLRWTIEEHKLNPDTDYKLLASGTGAAMIAAIDSGKIDAGMVVTTDRGFIMEKEKQGTYRVIEDFTSLPYAGFAALVLESWIKANPQAARGFVRALDKATADLKSDPSLGRKIIKKMYPNFSDSLVDATVKSAISRIPDKGQFAAPAVENLNKIMKGSDPDLKPVNVSDLLPKF